MRPVLSELEQHAKRQLGRMAHWPQYPATADALRDYVSVLAKLETREAITRFCDDLVLTPQDRCPTAGELNRMVYDLVAERNRVKSACNTCDSTGYVIIYKLVTYYNKSLRVKSAKIVADLELESARDYAEALAKWHKENPHADFQLLLPFAQTCVCRL